MRAYFVLVGCLVLGLGCPFTHEPDGPTFTDGGTDAATVRVDGGADARAMCTVDDDCVLGWDTSATCCACLEAWSRAQVQANECVTLEDRKAPSSCAEFAQPCNYSCNCKQPSRAACESGLCVAL